MTFRQFQRQLGRRVQKARWIAGWTQAEAADRIGLNFRYYCDLERYGANVTLETLFKIAEAYDRRVSDFTDVETAKRGELGEANTGVKPPKRGRKPKVRRRTAS